MCRNIKPLYNFQPPSTQADIEAAARQFVRKITGMSRPSSANGDAFETAIAEITRTCERLFESLETAAAPRDRATWEATHRARQAARFGRN
jgi:hypothetical protein